MDAKAAFEKFVIKHDPSGHCINLLAMNETGTNYLHPHVDIAWISWTASRAEIEIELDGDACHSDEYFCDGYRIATEAAEEAITSHGIRIKGKTE